MLDNTDFIKALNRLSEQNGINYTKLILGSNDEKIIEQEKYKKKMDLARNKIELMEDYHMLDIDYINESLKKLEDCGIDVGDVSDSYHTFNELYYHRMVLFSIILNSKPYKSFKSKKHADGSMYDNMFICGIKTEKGDYTYHYNLKYWDNFNIPEIENAPKWDGHLPDDITRLYYI